MNQLTASVALVWTLLFSTASRAALLDKPVSFDASWGYEFYELCKSLDIVCAVEVDSTVRQGADTLALSDTTGRKALATVMALYPGHRWEIKDGMLLVYPKQRKEKSPLDRRLNLIALNKVTFEGARTFFTKEMELITGPSAVTGPRGEPLDDSRLSLQARDIVVRDALMRIVKSHGHAMWMLDRYGFYNNRPFHTFELKRYAPPSTLHPTK